ncbi:hypothetical protein F6R98_13165 [Candidatus Methylospira mobilis]|uniref:Uncharacterized protein n=1 Tax=Candidatus Methylospira mobilis TaxID=1808979 RepID=A0A5Q0BJZ8_9GAMM|nr:hypothetical protein [Candidatus Methylospira mobilis]QFY43452.1 hypothetical protein F6R98_13165 [Candidatus Methylospira mobilis]WNV03309.1 hypothetical protein RP726_12670 [Candidatus Methylospira mobilis]
MNDKTREPTGKELIHIGAAEQVPTEYFDMDMLDTIPKDIGWMLLILGIIGIAVPGMVDIPLVIAGSIIIWPSTYRIFQRMARTKRQAHLLDAPVRFLSRFHADLEKRNPGGPQPVRSLTGDNQ